MSESGEASIRGTINLTECVAILMRDETKNVHWPDPAVFCFAIVVSERTVRLARA